MLCSGDLFQDVKLVKKLTDIIEKIWIKNKNEKWKNITVMNSYVTRSELFFGSYCFTLSRDLACESLEIFFKPMKGVKSVNLYFKDTLRLVHRALPEHDLEYVGGRNMKVSLSASDHTQFNVKISQNIHVEDKKSQNCINYPDAGYNNYGECDNAYVLKKLKTLFGSNFVPLWTAQNLSGVREIFAVKRLCHEFLVTFS